MGRTTKQAETTVFEILKQAPKSKKFIYKKFKDETLNLERKYAKKALKKLHRRGKIIKTGKIYSIVALSSSSTTTAATTTTGCTSTPLPATNTSSAATNNNNDDVKKDEGDNNNDNNKDVIPIAEKLRQNSKKQQRTKKKVSFVDPSAEEAIVVDDIDEEIKRLEMELQQQESDSESDSQSEGSFDDDDENDSTSSKQRDEEYRGTEDGEHRQQQDNDVLCLSKYANDRIETLPSSYLPLPGRYDSNDNNNKKKSKHKSTKGDGDRNNEVGRVQNHESRPSRGSGLESAVKELLQGYQARSSERLPFYCRFCSRQYRNESEFFNHKITEFHIMAVAMERKATYCRLCRKQLTSPEQMKEHLSSKPHKERLEKVRNRGRSINNNSQQQLRAQQQEGGGGGSCSRKFRQPKYTSSSIHRQWG